MIIKVSKGVVEQTFDNNGRCIEQEFRVYTANPQYLNEETYEELEVTPELEKLHHPFNMEQPNENLS